MIISVMTVETSPVEVATLDSSWTFGKRSTLWMICLMRGCLGVSMARFRCLTCDSGGWKEDHDEVGTRGMASACSPSSVDSGSTWSCRSESLSSCEEGELGQSLGDILDLSPDTKFDPAHIQAYSSITAFLCCAHHGIPQNQTVRIVQGIRTFVSSGSGQGNILLVVRRTEERTVQTRGFI